MGEEETGESGDRGARRVQIATFEAMDGSAKRQGLGEDTVMGRVVFAEQVGEDREAARLKESLPGRGEGRSRGENYGVRRGGADLAVVVVDNAAEVQEGERLRAIADPGGIELGALETPGLFGCVLEGTGKFRVVREGLLEPCAFAVGVGGEEIGIEVRRKGAEFGFEALAQDGLAGMGRSTEGDLHSRRSPGRTSGVWEMATT